MVGNIFALLKIAERKQSEVGDGYSSSFTLHHCLKGFVKSLVPVLALLYHYQTLLNELVFNLALAHRTFCKLLSVLLALFSDLVAKVL